jgi:hypothetical protein
MYAIHTKITTDTHIETNTHTHKQVLTQTHTNTHLKTIPACFFDEEFQQYNSLQLNVLQLPTKAAESDFINKLFH